MAISGTSVLKNILTCNLVFLECAKRFDTENRKLVSLLLICTKLSILIVKLDMFQKDLNDLIAACFHE